MSNLHGMFSVGGMLGAGLTFGLLHLSVAPRMQLYAVGGFVVVATLIASRAMLETHASIDSDARHFAKPKGILLLIGALVFAGMTAEGVLYDWSVLYLEKDVAMPHARAALGYATFTASMALARFGGDRLRARFPERAVLRWSAVVAAAAMAVVLLSASRLDRVSGPCRGRRGPRTRRADSFQCRDARARALAGLPRSRPSRTSATAAFSWGRRSSAALPRTAP
jgi:hypothetical protein